MTTRPFASLRLSAPDFQNPRLQSGLDDESIRELSLHIGLHGLLNPPLITQRGLVIAGQRRYRAIEILISPLYVNTPSFADALIDLYGPAAADLTEGEIARIQRNANELLHACPVRIIDGDPEGLALAESVQREALSGYEIARYLFRLHEQGATGANLVRLIGKSKTYVSRKLSTWRGACEELRAAWSRGLLADEAVQEMAQLPHDEQRKALRSPVPRGRRGPAHRPGIETVKQVLGELEKLGLVETPGIEVGKRRHAQGVLDAFRWVAGEQTSKEFAQLLEEMIDAGST